jgi:hypothetical protein
MPMRRGANTDPRISLMRRAANVNNHRGVGGREKTRNAPRPITLPKLKFTETADAPPGPHERR